MRRVDSSADDVWDVLRDFGDGSWTGVPVSADGQGVGAVRTVQMPFGSVVERCTRLDDDERVLGYALIDGGPGSPFASCGGEVRVIDRADGASELVWTVTYEPADPDGSAATGFLDGLLPAAAEALARYAERRA